jgi:hypothetical protein
VSVPPGYAADVAEPTDEELAEWLAEHAHVDLDEVRAGLEEGRRRRAFVVAELIEAGYEGDELLVLVVHLTGLTLDEARALIARQSAG